MKKWYDFIKHYQPMADIQGVDACDFHPTDEQLEMDGALPRPGKIGKESTNTKELTREFILKALPNRKYRK